MAKRPKLFIVDGSNNVYRSYFAIRGRPAAIETRKAT